MKTARRAAGMLLALSAALTVPLASAAPASAATWQLEDVEQEICTRPGPSNGNSHITYLLALVSGSSSAIIDLELRNLPPGSTSLGGRIYPDDWNERYDDHVAMVGLRLARAPEGKYVAEIRATDGKVTQSVPVEIVSTKDC